jgi:hypothetical protein
MNVVRLPCLSFPLPKVLVPKTQILLIHAKMKMKMEACVLRSANILCSVEIRQKSVKEAKEVKVMKQGDEAMLRTNDQEMPLSATHEYENRNVVHGSDRRRNRCTYPVPRWLGRVLFNGPWTYRPCPISTLHT